MLRSGKPIIMTRCHKRVAKSLGRSRGNWRKHPMGHFIFNSIYCFWLCHIVGRLYCSIIFVLSQPILTYKWPPKNPHFKLQKSPLTKAVSILSAPMFAKWPLYYHLTSRGHNFTLWRNVQSWNVICPMKVPWLRCLLAWSRPGMTFAVNWALKTNVSTSLLASRPSMTFAVNWASKTNVPLCWRQ